jgi:hypothetical protein
MVGKPHDGIERVGQARLECAALVGEFQSVGMAPEQRKSKTLFQQLHRSAHRGLGDIQLLRCRGEAAVSGRYLERPESI